MSNIQDLEILSKYLSEDELKDIAKEVAIRHFTASLSKENPHAKSNLDFYIGQGALQAVLQYGSEIDFDFHAKELKEKVSEIISKLTVYNLPRTYIDLAEKQIESQKEDIQNQMKTLISDFVNGGSYPSLYSTFQEKVRETLADLLYNLLEKNFKK